MIPSLPHIENLGCPRNIWAVSAPDGDVEALNRIHEVIWRGFKPGDKVIYHGNYLGNPARVDNPDAIDAINLFAHALQNNAAAGPQDIICLKGQREELWLKTLQLQFANKPHDVLEWLLSRGMEGILNHYGSSGEEGFAACRGGIIPLTRWTGYLRQRMYEKSGHAAFYHGLKDAAYTRPSDGGSAPMLFVHSGIDPAKPLESQEDNFWWGGRKLNRLERNYSGFRYIVRGYDPQGQGALISGNIISICGQGNGRAQVNCARITGCGRMQNLYSF